MGRGVEDVQGPPLCMTLQRCTPLVVRLSPHDTKSDPSADCTLGTMVCHQGSSSATNVTLGGHAGGRGTVCYGGAGGT